MIWVRSCDASWSSMCLIAGLWRRERREGELCGAKARDFGSCSGRPRSPTLLGWEISVRTQALISWENWRKRLQIEHFPASHVWARKEKQHVMTCYNWILPLLALLHEDEFTLLILPPCDSSADPPCNYGSITLVPRVSHENSFEMRSKKLLVRMFNCSSSRIWSHHFLTYSLYLTLGFTLKTQNNMFWSPCRKAYHYPSAPSKESLKKRSNQRSKTTPWVILSCLDGAQKMSDSWSITWVYRYIPILPGNC